METNTSQWLIKCQKRRDVIKTRGGVNLGEVWRKAVYCPDGDRHGGGVNVTQAFVRNVGTYGSDDNGKIQAEIPQG
ncbi:hypothetical protein D3C79_1083010 [compost metagenome]